MIGAPGARPDPAAAGERADLSVGPRAVIDLHCHTNASFDSLASPSSVVEAAAARGLTHLAITDHDRIDGALRAREAAPGSLDVIVGEEVRTQEGDLICLFLEHPIPSGSPVRATIAAAREQGALVGIPHPFDRYRASLLMNDDLEGLADLVDWIETWNARLVGRGGNERAATFAHAHGLPGVAVSDAHSVLEVGMAHSLMNGDPTTPAGLRNALQTVAHGGASPADLAGTAGPIGRLVQRARSAIGPTVNRSDPGQ